MPREVWLRPNRRALALGLVPACLLLAAGLAAIAMAWLVVGWTLLAGGVYLAGVVVWAMRQPRLAYQDGQLLVYLGGPGPRRVPIDVVECFFLGQGPSMLPATPRDDDQQPETSTVVVRLAESAEAWKHIEVKRSLGHWCDGYIST